MTHPEQGRGAATAPEAEASRVRLRVLEAFWKSSGLAARERRAQLEAALRDSVSSLDASIRDRVVARVMEELAGWAPAPEPASTGGSVDQALRDALESCLAGEAGRPVTLVAEEERLIECVRLIVSHLNADSENYNSFLRIVGKRGTLLTSTEFQKALRAIVKSDPSRKCEKETERLRGVLRSLSLSRDLLYRAAVAAAAKALTKLVADLNISKALVVGKRGLEELEKLYDETAALSSQQLTEKYFSDLYSKEIQKGGQ